MYVPKVRKRIYNYTSSQLPATLNNYFKLIADVHSYNTTQIKTQQFALLKGRSNSPAKMVKYSAIEICEEFLQKQKIEHVCHFFWQSIRNMSYLATRNILRVLTEFMYMNPSGLI